ncbi:MAG: hypothetical protein P8Y76_11785, partial [bacterium]
MRVQLRADIRAEVGTTGIGACDTIEQPPRELGRHEKAHQLAAAVGRDIDAEHPPRRVDDRTAAHAGIDRAGEVEALVILLLRPAVVGALDHGQALVQGIAQGEALVALGERGVAQGERAGVAAVALQHGEIVDHVHGDDLERPAAPA